VLIKAVEYLNELHISLGMFDSIF